MKVATAVANANIALIKYWGKACQTHNIPAAPSLSMTLDGLGTTSTIMLATTDSLLIDNQPASALALERVLFFLNAFRKKYGIKDHLKIISKNSIPFKAGLASSASAFASISLALNELFSLKLTNSELSRLARLGSASAARSIFGPFSGLLGGVVSEDQAIAFPVKYNPQLELSMLLVLVDLSEKSISSREAMNHTAMTSPYYRSFIEGQASDYFSALNLLELGDLRALGELMEHSALKMHAAMWAAKPSINFLKPQSIEAINVVKNLRKKHDISCYFTVDAGPNIKILLLKKDLDLVTSLLKQYLPQIKLIETSPGADAYISPEHLI